MQVVLCFGILRHLLSGWETGKLSQDEPRMSFLTALVEKSYPILDCRSTRIFGWSALEVAGNWMEKNAALSLSLSSALNPCPYVREMRAMVSHLQPDAAVCGIFLPSRKKEKLQYCASRLQIKVFSFAQLLQSIPNSANTNCLSVQAHKSCKVHGVCSKYDVFPTQFSALKGTIIDYNHWRRIAGYGAGCFSTERVTPLPSLQVSCDQISKHLFSLEVFESWHMIRQYDGHKRTINNI